MKRILLIGLVAISAVGADKGWKLPPENVTIEKAPGAELVAAQCALCHSLDYIAIQPPMDRAGWMAGILKMRDRYGAPLAPGATNALVDYLVKNYGTEKAGKK